jgi:hypothetical protein
MFEPSDLLCNLTEQVDLPSHASNEPRPTYWPTDINKIPDVIDFYISKKVPMRYMKIEDSYDLDSDHSPIIMTLSDKIIKKEANPTLTKSLTGRVFSLN